MPGRKGACTGRRMHILEWRFGNHCSVSTDVIRLHLRDQDSCTYQLYEYAARNWGYHARQAPKSSQLIVGFLESERKVEASSQALMFNKEDFGYAYSLIFPRNMTGVHLATYFELEEVVNAVLSSKRDPDLTDSHRRTLSYAAANEHETVVRLLLEKRMERRR
jgi:hypothetical protein